MKVHAYALGINAFTEGSHDFTLENISPDRPNVVISTTDLTIIPAQVLLGPSHVAVNHVRATELVVRRILRATRVGATVAVWYGRENLADASFVGGLLLSQLGIGMDSPGAERSEIYASQFLSYLSEYGFDHVVCELPSGTQSHPISGFTAENQAGTRTRLLSAFALSYGKGLIYLVPANVVPGEESHLLVALTDAIEAHCRSVLVPDTAPIAASFTFTEESILREEQDRQRIQLERLDERIADYQTRKDVLFLRDDPLAERLPEWITTYIGFPSERLEEYIEDFWLNDRDGRHAVICEAKGLTQNVRREHITAVMLHREQRDLADDFPAILIANTFADAETVKVKGNQRVGPIECQKAARDGVLVIRTLDLVTLLDQLERGVTSKDEIWKLLTTAAGWLKVTGDAREVVKE